MRAPPGGGGGGWGDKQSMFSNALKKGKRKTAKVNTVGLN